MSEKNEKPAAEEILSGEELETVTGGISSMISLVTDRDLLQTSVVSKIRFAQSSQSQMNMVAFD